MTSGGAPTAPRPGLYIHADATPAIGAGHAMRCATLGAAWRALGGAATLTGVVSLPFVATRLAEAGISVGDAATTADGVLVVDSYDERRREALATAPARLRVLVDDLGGEVPPGYDVVWNPNAYGTTSLYPGFAGEVLTGPEAVPVRPGLPRWAPDGERCGVMLGGGAPSATIVDALVAAGRAIGGEWVGVGAWVPERWTSADAVAPWRALSRCARIVTAAGSAVWECAAVGIPAVVVETVPNQRLVAEWAAAAGVPVVRTHEFDADAVALAEALASAVAKARPLPPITEGAPAVAAALLARAERRLAEGAR